MQTAGSKPRYQSDPFFMKEFSDACTTDGCPLCGMRDRHLWRMLDTLLWENVTDPGVRKEILAGRGFCHRHACTLLEAAECHAAALGVAIIYEHLMRQFLEELKDINFVARSVRRPRSKQAASLVPTRQCFACIAERETEERNISLMLQHLHQDSTRDETRGLYERSSGLCLPHFDAAMQAIRSGQLRDYLKDMQLQQLTSLHFDLCEFIRKHDYKVKDKAWGSERDSWRRAVYTCTGYRTLKEQQHR